MERFTWKEMRTAVLDLYIRLNEDRAAGRIDQMHSYLNPIMLAVRTQCKLVSSFASSCHVHLSLPLYLLFLRKSHQKLRIDQRMRTSNIVGNVKTLRLSFGLTASSQSLLPWWVTTFKSSIRLKASRYETLRCIFIVNLKSPIGWVLECLLLWIAYIRV